MFPLRMNCINVSDPLSFPLTPSSGLNGNGNGMDVNGTQCLWIYHGCGRRQVTMMYITVLPCWYIFLEAVFSFKFVKTALNFL